MQQKFHSSRTSGQPIISLYGSCNFQVDRPSRENRQPGQNFQLYCHYTMSATMTVYTLS